MLKTRHIRIGAHLAISHLIWLAIAVISCVALIGCQPAAPTPGVTEQAAIKQKVDAIQATWLSGPHSETYVEKDSSNSACSRCHAPINYVPPPDEIPKTCNVCKFEVKPAPPLTAKADWKSITCNVCHEVKNGVADPKVKWLASITANEYQDVASTTELCQKCHLPDLKAPHKPVVVKGSHTSMTCTKCHDAHSTSASCSNSLCHKDVMPSSTLPGHDAKHQAVNCSACHDGGGNKVAPDPTSKNTWKTLTPEGIPFISHNIVRAVSCEKCHFTGNPWKLIEKVEAKPAK